MPLATIGIYWIYRLYRCGGISGTVKYRYRAHNGISTFTELLIYFRYYRTTLLSEALLPAIYVADTFQRAILQSLQSVTNQDSFCGSMRFTGTPIGVCWKSLSINSCLSLIQWPIVPGFALRMGLLEVTNTDIVATCSSVFWGITKELWLGRPLSSLGALDLLDVVTVSQWI